MDLVDLDRLCWVLVYWRGIVVAIVVSFMSSGWVCLFRIFVDKVAGVIIIYIEVICLVLSLFDFD